MKITNPQRKLLLKLKRLEPGTFRLAKGEWIAGRALKEKGLITETYPKPALTDAGREVCKSLTH